MPDRRRDSNNRPAGAASPGYGDLMVLLAALVAEINMAVAAGSVAHLHGSAAVARARAVVGG